MLQPLVILILVSSVLTTVFVPVSVRIARRHAMIELQRHRKGPDVLMTRGSGLAIVMATVLAAGIVTLVEPGWFGLDDWWFVGGAVAFGILGLADDFRPQAPALRLAAQFAIATVVIVAISPQILEGPVWISVLIAIGATVVFVNVFNFMDGIDGMSVGTATVVGAFLVVAGLHWDDPTTVTCGALAIGGAAGFGPFNFPVARAFLGDSGAYFFGGILVLGAISAVRAGAPIISVCLPGCLYLADVFTTLVRRLFRGSPLTGRHREFAFHRLASSRMDHFGTTMFVTALNLALAALAIASFDRSAATQALLFGAGLVLIAAYLSLPRALRVVGETWVAPHRAGEGEPESLRPR